MANPQAENGHSRINHETLEHLLRLHLNGTQWDLIMCVIRQTWGFNRKADHIPLSKFLDMTGRARAGIRKELAILVEAHVLLALEPPSFTKAGLWQVNKDWEQWRYTPVAEGQSSSPVPQKRVAQCHSSGIAQCHSSGPSKESIKERERKREPRPDPAREILDHWLSKPNLKHPTAKDTIEAGLRATRVRLKAGRSSEHLKQAIDHYSLILTDTSGQFWLTHKWTLQEFMRHKSGDTVDKMAGDGWKSDYQRDSWKPPAGCPSNNLETSEFKEPCPSIPQEQLKTFQEIADKVEAELETVPDIVERNSRRWPLVEKICSDRGVAFNQRVYTIALVIRQQGRQAILKEAPI